MRLGIPQALTAADAEAYDATLKPGADGITFSGASAAESGGAFSYFVAFPPETPYEQAIKDVFFDNPELSFVFKSFRVVCESRYYSLMPESLFSDKDKEMLFSYCHNVGKRLKVLDEPIEALNAHLLFGLNLGVYEFLVRSLSAPVFSHYLTPLLGAWLTKSELSYLKQLHIVIRKGYFDMMCFERGELRFMNAFDYDAVSDIVYYIMYANKQLGVNQLDDRLFFYGDEALCSSVMNIAGAYVRNIEYVSEEPTVQCVS
jgi:hypothetical protein